MSDVLSDNARRVLQLANQEAIKITTEWIGPEHVLIALAAHSEGSAAEILASVGISEKEMREAYNNATSLGPEMIIIGKLPSSSDTKLLLEKAAGESRRFNCHYIGTEHLLLGAVDVGAPLVKEILDRLEISREEIQAAVIRHYCLHDEGGEITNLLCDWWRALSSEEPPRDPRTILEGIADPDRVINDLFMQVRELFLSLRNAPLGLRYLLCLLNNGSTFAEGAMKFRQQEFKRDSLSANILNAAEMVWKIGQKPVADR